MISLTLKFRTNTEINYIQFSNCNFNDDGNGIKTETEIQHLIVHDCQFIDSSDQGHLILFQGTTGTKIVI